MRVDLSSLWPRCSRWFFSALGLTSKLDSSVTSSINQGLCGAPEAGPLSDFARHRRCAATVTSNRRFSRGQRNMASRPRRLMVGRRTVLHLFSDKSNICATLARLWLASLRGVFDEGCFGTRCQGRVRPTESWFREGLRSCSCLFVWCASRTKRLGGARRPCRRAPRFLSRRVTKTTARCRATVLAQGRAIRAGSPVPCPARGRRRASGCRTPRDRSVVTTARLVRRVNPRSATCRTRRMGPRSRGRGGACRGLDHAVLSSPESLTPG